MTTEQVPTLFLLVQKENLVIMRMGIKLKIQLTSIYMQSFVALKLMDLNQVSKGKVSQLLLQEKWVRLGRRCAGRCRHQDSLGS